MFGNVRVTDLSGDEYNLTSRRDMDGKGIILDGSSWIDAGQGVNNVFNISGKEIAIFARVKLDEVRDINPVLTKYGNDQNIAYSIIFEKVGDELILKTMVGSDDIAGAYLLRYSVPEEDWLKWHDILFQFSGKTSELYVDGFLRDDEVTVGNVRDSNRRPLLIGAIYADEEGYVPQQPYTPRATLVGKIDDIIL